MILYSFICWQNRENSKVKAQLWLCCIRSLVNTVTTWTQCRAVLLMVDKWSVSVMTTRAVSGLLANRCSTWLASRWRHLAWPSAGTRRTLARFLFVPDCLYTALYGMTHWSFKTTNRCLNVLELLSNMLSVCKTVVYLPTWYSVPSWKVENFLSCYLYVSVGQLQTVYTTKILRLLIFL